MREKKSEFEIIIIMIQKRLNPAKRETRKKIANERRKKHA